MNRKQTQNAGASRRLFLEWLRPFRGQIAMHLGTLILVTAITATVPYFTGALAGCVAAGDAAGAYRNIAYAAGATLVCQVLWFTWWRRDLRCFERELPRTIEKLGLDMVARFSLGQCKGESSTFRRIVMLEGQRALVSMVGMAGFDLAPSLAKAMIFTVVIAWTSPLVGALVALSTAAYIWYSVAVNRRYRPSLEALERKRTAVAKFTSEYTRHLGDAMAAAQELRLNGEVLRRTETMHEGEVEFWGRHHVRMNNRDTLLHLSRFGTLALMVALVVRGQVSVADFVALMTWHAMLCEGLSRIGAVARQWVMANVQLGRYSRMLATEPAVNPNEDSTPREIVGKIEFRDVSFLHPEGKSFEEEEGAPASPKKKKRPKERVGLSGVSFAVNPGETLALVGESGAGKSTTLDLLLRGFDPDSGEILVDGVPLRDLNLRDFRRQIGYVPQDVSLFDGTLRANVLFRAGDQPVSEEQLRRALDVSKVSTFLVDREEDVDCLIGERGVRLSGGERQRIGIARAILLQPKVIILDEATSSLDARNEGAIYQAVFESPELSGATRIIIAHRLSTIRRANKIVFLEKGRVIDVGSHDELMRRCEPYQALVREQAYTVVIDGNGDFVEDGTGQDAVALADAAEGVFVASPETT